MYELHLAKNVNYAYLSGFFLLKMVLNIIFRCEKHRFAMKNTIWKHFQREKSIQMSVYFPFSTGCNR